MIALDTLLINSVICTVASLVLVAIPEISVATTENPLPASPARAASMLAFNARRLVWFVIPPINFYNGIHFIHILVQSFPDFSVTSVPLSTEASTSDARCSISCLPSANAFRVSVMLFPISSTAVATSSTLS